MSEYLSKSTITIRRHYLLCVRLHLAAHFFVVKIFLDLRDLLPELDNFVCIALLAKLDLLLSDEGVLLRDRILSLVVCSELRILILIGLY